MVLFILRKIYAFLIDTLQSLFIAATIFLIIYWQFFRPFQVSGESMSPNFLNRQYVLTNLISLRFSPLKQGDVVVFRAPPDPDKDYIKRIIGLAGDTVMISEGRVYVNGNVLDESRYLDPSVKTFSEQFLSENQTVTVPQDAYFVLGDNREHSSDSRDFGFVSKDLIIGKSFFIYWPINEASLVKNPYEET